MKLNYTLALLLAGLLLSLGCAKNGVTTGSFGGNTAGGVQGTVNDGLTGIPGVLVQVLGTGLQTTTSADGTYQINNIPANLQTLRFSKSGYTSADQQIAILPGQTVLVDQILFASQPVLLWLAPEEGALLERITLVGTGFGTTQGTVRFNGALASIISWLGEQIVVQAPAASSGRVAVTAAGITTGDDVIFTFLEPSLDSLDPDSGSAGTLVTISGSNFGLIQGTAILSFNGTDAPGTVSWGNTQIITTVPVGAESGELTLHTCGGDSNSLPFTVNP